MQTRLISTGPADDNLEGEGASFEQASVDGARVFFSANGILVDEDEDAGDDVYVRAGDETFGLSLEPLGSGLKGQTSFQDATADGSHAWFTTDAPLVPEDEDEQQDIYEWTDGQGEVELISTGPLDDAGDLDVDYEGSSADGSQVLFSTRIVLTDDDTDDARDLYRRAGGETTLVTPDPAVGDGEFVELGVFDVSPDGSRIYIVTTEGLVAADEDGLEDFYELSGDDVRLLTPGTALTEFDAMRYEGRTSDGTHIYFTTPERLDDADTDVSVDVYETTADGQTNLLSTGPEAEGGNFEASFVDATSDGSRVILATEERLTEDDPDEDRDLYVRENGELRLLSDKGEEDVFLGDITADGRRIVYDDDSDSDHVFVTDGGPSVELPGITGDSVALSADGTRLLVESLERLLAEDTDDEADLYRMTLGLPPRNTTPPAITGTAAVGRRAQLLDRHLERRRGAVHVHLEPQRHADRRRDRRHLHGGAARRRQAAACTVTATNESARPRPPAPQSPCAAVAGPPPPPPPSGPLPGPCANLQTGTAAAETLTGTDAGDLLRGLGGDDELIGLGGADCLTGGAGQDRLSGGAGADRLAGSKGPTGSSPAAAPTA